MPDIHLLAAAPWEPDLFVAGEWERTAHVWSLSTSAAVSSIDTAFDPGGRRLCLVTGDVPVVVAGAWARHGVCGYSLTGELLWQDRTRSTVQYVTALSGGRVAVGYAKGPARVLVAATGKELQSLRGVLAVIALAPATHVLVSSSSVRLADAELGPTTRQITLPPFAPVVRGAAAGPDSVALTAGDGVWFLDPGGARRATFEVRGGHAVDVAYGTACGRWQVVTRAERSGEVRFQLVHLTPDAEVLDRSPLPHVDDAVWLDDGRVLVFGNEDGVFALDGSTGTTRLPIEPT